MAEIVCGVNLLTEYAGWEAAIADAEQQALASEQRAVRLRAVASVLKKRMKAGESWPGLGRNV
jgi:hypothetical protein